MNIRQKNDIKTLNAGRKPIFVDSPKAAEEVIQDQNKNTIIYIDTKGHNTTDEKIACSKLSSYQDKGKSKSTYFVRQYNIGPFRNQVFNPIETPEDNLNSRALLGNDPKYNWLKVSKRIYDLYNRFLINKNSVYLTQVHMELTNNG